MQTFLIKPSFKLILLQMLIVVFFSLSLYWYVHSKNVLTSLQEQLTVIQTRAGQLKITEKKLSKYAKLLGERPEIATIPEKIIWEKVEFTWSDIPYVELLHRLEGVYSDERIFSLESFSFHPTDKNSVGSQEQNQDIDHPFQLKGYYLCLCR